MLADALAYAVDELEPDVARRRRHPDRRDEGRARPAAPAATSPTTRRWPTLLDAAAATSGEPLWRMPLVDDYEEQARLQGRRRRQRRRRRRRDHRGAVPPALRRRRAVGPPRHRLGRRRRPTERYEWTAGPTGFGARACCSPGSAREDPLEGIALMHGPDRPLVAGRRARGRRGGARGVRRRDLARAVHRHGRAALQDLADACRASGSRAATSSPPTRPARTFQATFTAGAAESPGSQIIGIAADPDRGVRHRRDRRGLRTASSPRRAPDAEPLRPRGPTPSWRPAGRRRPAAAPAPATSCSAIARPRSRIGDGLLVALGGVGDPVVPQRVVEGHDAAGAQQPQRLLEVGGVLALVAVAEDQVVVAVGEAGEHVERRRRRWCGPAARGCRPR